MDKSKKEEFKDRSFELIASIAKAMGNAHRLEILELLGNGPKSVEQLAEEARMTFTNTSQHLQRLKHARLVKTRREFTTIKYMLADDAIPNLIRTLHTTAYSRLAEYREQIEQMRQYYGVRTALADDQQDDEIQLIDVRNEIEFSFGHKEGAINIPLDKLEKSLGKLDRSKKIITYCRGELCTLADEAVQLLQNNGFDAQRMDDILYIKTA